MEGHALQIILLYTIWCKYLVHIRYFGNMNIFVELIIFKKKNISENLVPTVI